MDMAVILFSDAETFEQIVNIPLTECSMCILVKLVKTVLEEKTVKEHKISYMFIAQSQGQITKAGLSELKK